MTAAYGRSLPLLMAQCTTFTSICASCVGTASLIHQGKRSLVKGRVLRSNKEFVTGQEMRGARGGASSCDPVSSP